MEAPFRPVYGAFGYGNAAGVAFPLFGPDKTSATSRHRSDGRKTPVFPV